ncbi:MAG: endolytic transglycosylase MltG [Acidobacteria bacterium]|nr:endolytic transglycosylase MltG [Acidobacteriota bacterium]
MRKGAIAGTLTLLVLGICAIVASLIVRDRLYDPYQGYADAEQFVVIAPGTGTAAIRRSLVEAGIVRDEFAFRAALWWTGHALHLQAGEYRFDSPSTAVDVIERIASGDVHTRPITFPEGLTIAEMAETFESRGFGAAADFEAAAGDASLIRSVDVEAVDLEGYLFPETYALPRDTSASSLVAMMVSRFLDTFDESWRSAAEEQGLTVRQVATLASLVEKETGAPDERPVVAAVYRNRLRIGMLLQADPTVVYAMRLAGTYAGNIRRSDLAMDSPYNTYRYAGLPPGPIAAPGAAALAAVLSPADVNYLYFVSRNDGTHAFARTLAEHNRNVREFQILYFRR